MIYGLFICLLSAFAAMMLARLQSFVGAPMIGLFIGIIIANLLPEKVFSKLKKGGSFSSKYLLKIGIIITGATLSLRPWLALAIRLAAHYL